MFKRWLFRKLVNGIPFHIEKFKRKLIFLRASDLKEPVNGEDAKILLENIYKVHGQKIIWK